MLKNALKFCLVVFYLVTQLYHISLDAGLSSIVWCSLSDPYAVMMTADGSIILLEFTLEGTEPKVKISRPQINQVNIQNKKANIFFTNLNPVSSRFLSWKDYHNVKLQHDYWSRQQVDSCLKQKKLNLVSFCNW